MRFIFIRLAVVGFSMCEIPRHCERIRSYSRSRHPRSSILVSVESAHALFLLFISNVWRICYRFEILTFKAVHVKWLVFPPLSCLLPPLTRNALEFLDEIYPAKTIKWWSYCTLKISES